MTVRLGQCRSCGAQMLWAWTEAGKQMPLNAEPTVSGNLILVGFGDEVIVRALQDGEQTDGDRYISHFATCPKAADWRKR